MNADWPLLLGATLLGSLGLRLWARLRPQPEGPERRGVDLAIAGGLVVAAAVVFVRAHAAINPDWVPRGQDNQDYLACVSSLRWSEPELWSRARYPFYPAVVAGLGAGLGVPVARVAMGVALACSALVPAAAYALGRACAPRPVALAGALLTFNLYSHRWMVGMPTDYPLAAAVCALALASVVVAVREGGATRAGLAGAVLAADLLITPKSLPMLVLGVAALAASATLRREPRALLAAGLPLAAAWMAFARLGRPIFSLEWNVLAVQRAEGWYDAAAFPAVGWGPDSPPDHAGYWVPGTTRALAHLPDVARFLLHPPVRVMSAAERLDVFVPRLSAELSLTGLSGLLALALVGALGAGRGSTRAFGAVAAGFAGAAVAAHLWGLSSAPYTERYALPMAVTVPGLMLAAAALPVRSEGARSWAAFAPLLLAVAWVLGPSPGAFGARAMTTVTERWVHGKPPPIAAIRTLDSALQPGDAVVDATDTRLVRALLDRQPVSVTLAPTQPQPAGLALQFGADAAPHRYLVLDCVNQGELDPASPLARLQADLDADPRFARLDTCIYADQQPDQPYRHTP